MKNLIVIALLAAGAAHAAPGDAKSDKEYWAQQAQVAKMQVKEPDNDMAWARSKTFWLLVGLVAAVPIGVFVRKR